MVIPSNMESFLNEVCGTCGLLRGAHNGNMPEWCPAHQGRMDYMETTVFIPSGIRLSKAVVPFNTPARNINARKDK